MQLRKQLEATEAAIAAAAAREIDLKASNAALFDKLLAAQAEAKAAASKPTPPASVRSVAASVRSVPASVRTASVKEDVTEKAPAPEAPAPEAPAPDTVPWKVIVHTSDVSGGAFDGA